MPTLSVVIKPIEDTKDRFYISSDGRVYSAHQNFGFRLRKSVMKKGVPQINLDNRWYKIAQLVARYFLPIPTELADKPLVAKTISNNVEDCRVENLRWEVSKVQFAGLSHELNREVFSWSKWGGANHGALKEKKSPIWMCQTCGQTQTHELPSYLFELAPHEYIRICSTCQNVKHLHQIVSFTALVRLVRHHADIFGDS